MRFILMFALSWIFLPGRYTHLPPRKPFVEALPDPREHMEVYSWSHTHLWDRNGGYYERTYFNAPSRYPHRWYR